LLELNHELIHEHNTFSLPTSYRSSPMSKPAMLHEEHQLDTMGTLTAEDRDRMDLARLGKKQVLKVCIGRTAARVTRL
jgi:hypothetical protein